MTLAARQAEAIAAAMARKRPELRDTFQNNFEALAKDQDIQAAVSKKPSLPLIVSHPVYDYFTKRYGLNVIKVHWESVKRVQRDSKAAPGPMDNLGGRTCRGVGG